MQDLHDKTGTKLGDLLHSLYLAEEGFRNSKRVMGPDFSRPLESFLEQRPLGREKGFWERLKGKKEL